jgi:hypothetical protein
MATRRRILIKNIDKETISHLIKSHYSIGRNAIFDYEYREVFLDQSNYVFIVFDAFLKDWTEIELDFNKSVKEHDDFLMTISRDFKTTVIFGYEQTTTGDARLLVLKNGQVTRSIYQKAYYNPFKILMEDDFGEKLPFEENFSYPEIGQNIENFKFLAFDEIQEMFADAGYTGKERIYFDEKYLHLEYLK